MSYTQPFYINGPSLSSSTAIFDDAALTICSPDGFYSDGVVVREQVGCVLLPEQICTACCNDLCSGWTISALIGTVTYQFDNCVTETTEIVTVTGPFDEDICALRGTTPVILFGKASLVHRQDCGCCVQDCNTYKLSFKGSLGESVNYSYIDCTGVEQIASTTETILICCKTNTVPQIISGSGYISFYACSCVK